MHHKAKAWFRRFPPVNSPDRIDDDQPRGDGGVGETEDDKVDEDRAVEMSDAKDQTLFEMKAEASSLWWLPVM